MNSEEEFLSVAREACAAFENGQWLDTVRKIDRALNGRAPDVRLLNVRARALEALGQHEDALRSVERCLEQDPSNVADLRNRGLMLLKLNRKEEALATFDVVLNVNPLHTDVLVKRAYLLHQMDRREEALESAERAVAAAPNDLQALNVRGMILDNFCNYQAALADFSRILNIDPNFVDAINNRGMIHARNAEFEQALDCYERSLQMAPGQPQALYNKAMVKLSMGNWTEGFREFESRWNIAPLEAARFKGLAPIWLGREDLSGKTILLHHEQGYGDTLQFARFVPLVANKAKKVILAVPDGLQRIIATLPGGAEVISEGAPVPAHDFCCPLMSLALAFGVTPDDVPGEVPYLSVPSGLAEGWGRKLGRGTRIRIGVAWSGRRYAPINHPRDMALSTLQPILNLDADFVCLQTEMAEEDERLLNRLPHLITFGNERRDFADTAAIISHLDLVISVDTAVAHLAGALGKPVWLLNRYASCWRWLQHRSDSPWYPTLRQFRQSTVGDWDDVVNRLKISLSALIEVSLASRSSPAARPVVDHSTVSQQLVAKGLEIHHRNERDAAIPFYRAALCLRQGDHGAMHCLGVAYAQQGQFEEAAAVLGRVATLQPQDASAHNHYGNALAALQRGEEALFEYERAISLKPRSADIHYNKGVALEKMGRLTDALSSYEEALQINPAYASAFNNRGNVLSSLGRIPQALSSYERAIDLRPEYLEAWINRANALRTLHEYEKAIDCARHALSLDPESAEAHGCYGAVLACAGEYEQAQREYEEALSRRPDMADGLWNKAILHLARGEFREGWPLYESRWRVASLRLAPRRDSAPLWLGKESLEGKTILLHHEQGYGDSLQFCRYVPMVSAMGARVILGMPAALASLMSSLKGVHEVVVRGSIPEHDYHCPLLSLPLAFGTDGVSIPSTHRYLVAASQRMEPWKERLRDSRGPRVGIVWSGKPTHTNDLNRSMRLETLRPLLVKKVAWVSLQKEIRSSDRATVAQLTECLFLGEGLTDFEDAAALIEQLDLVISVDTAIAHLAGALGKPVWVLLPRVADWRWLQNRSDCPWYPTARLFRQSQPRDWEGVVIRVGEALDEFLTSFRQNRRRREPAGIPSRKSGSPMNTGSDIDSGRLH